MDGIGRVWLSKALSSKPAAQPRQTSTSPSIRFLDTIIPVRGTDALNERQSSPESENQTPCRRRGLPGRGVDFKGADATLASILMCNTPTKTSYMSRSPSGSDARKMIIHEDNRSGNDVRDLRKLSCNATISSDTTARPTIYQELDNGGQQQCSQQTGDELDNPFEFLELTKPKVRQPPFDLKGQSKFSSWSSSQSVALQEQLQTQLGEQATLNVSEAGDDPVVDWGSIGPPSPVISDRAIDALESMGLRQIDAREGGMNTELDKLIVEQRGREDPRPPCITQTKQLHVKSPLETVGDAKEHKISPEATGETLYHTAVEDAKDLAASGCGATTASSLHSMTESSVSFANIKVWREVVAIEGMVARRTTLNDVRADDQAGQSHCQESHENVVARSGTYNQSCSRAASELSFGTSNLRRISAKEAARLFKDDLISSLGESVLEERTDVPPIVELPRTAQTRAKVAAADDAHCPDRERQDTLSRRDDKLARAISTTSTKNTFGVRSERRNSVAEFGISHATKHKEEATQSFPTKPALEWQDEGPRGTVSEESGQITCERSTFRRGKGDSPEKRTTAQNLPSRELDDSGEGSSSTPLAEGSALLSLQSPPSSRGLSKVSRTKTLGTSAGLTSWLNDQFRGDASDNISDTLDGKEGATPSSVEIPVKRRAGQNRSAELRVLEVIAERVGVAGDALMALRHDLIDLSQRHRTAPEHSEGGDEHSDRGGQRIHRGRDRLNLSSLEDFRDDGQTLYNFGRQTSRPQGSSKQEQPLSHSTARGSSQVLGAYTTKMPSGLVAAAIPLFLASEKPPLEDDSAGPDIQMTAGRVWREVTRDRHNAHKRPTSLPLNSLAPDHDLGHSAELTAAFPST